MSAPIYRASLELPTELAEAVAARLESAEEPAAAAVTLFGHGDTRTQVTAYYLEEPRRACLLDLLKGACAVGLDALNIEPVADRNWVVEAEGLRPAVRAGRFLVHGAHDRNRLAYGRYAIEIDAGLAFGTAHHASTKGCLIALDALLRERRPRTVLDIGTGSGVLAIAAAKATGASVLAGDNDRVAAAVAAENAKKNGVAARVLVLTAKGLAHRLLRQRRADLLFANILLRPLLSLAPAFARAVRPGGICVLSGILSSQAAQVGARYRSLGFTLKSRILLDGWTTLVMSRRSERRPRD